MMRSRVRLAFGLAAAALGAGAIIAYTATSSTAAAIVTPLNANTAFKSGFALVSSLGGTYSGPPGQPQDQPCVGLDEVQLASPTLSTTVALDLTWNDPQDGTRSLHNPHAFIGVQVYYNDPLVHGTSCTVGTLTLYPDPGAEANGQLTREASEVVLHPSRAGESTLYVLGGIHVPGGYPPGQQSGTGALQFVLNVIQ